jgi:hypothetical protein
MYYGESIGHDLVFNVRYLHAEYLFIQLSSSLEDLFESHTRKMSGRSHNSHSRQAVRDTSSSGTLLKALGNEEVLAVLKKHGVAASQVQQLIPIAKKTPVQAQRPEYAVSATVDDVRRNDNRLIPIQHTVIDFAKYIPGLARKTPAEIIIALAKRFEKDPTTDNSLLLQAAINKYSFTHDGGSHEVKHATVEAKKLFHQHPVKKGAAQDDIWFNAFVDEDYAGGNLYLDLPPGPGYYGYSWVGSGFNDKLTSIKCGISTSEVGAYVIIFKDVNFGNNFMIFFLGTNRTQIDDPNVGNAFNDVTSSILMIRRFSNDIEPIPFQSLISKSAMAATAENYFVFQSNNGDPIYAWSLWPNGSNNQPNDPGKKFIYVRVSCSVRDYTDGITN